MQKPESVEGPIETARWAASQGWRDLMSIYYANSFVWRWLKSGALIFLGLFLWAGSAVVYGLRPEWTVLIVPMAYGFVLILWGPLTHMLIVPTVLRLRRSANTPTRRTLARHGSKLNFSLFLVIVVVLAVLQPGIMLLDFAPDDADPTQDVRGEIDCSEPVDGEITCQVHDPHGFDHVAVISTNGAVIARDDQSPYEVTFDRDAIDGTRYLVQLRDADGNRLKAVSQQL